MDWSPDNKHRCDSKLCKYATICNLITLFLILVFITGLAQANMSQDRMAVDFRPDEVHHKLDFFAGHLSSQSSNTIPATFPGQIS